jgi:uncharacterized protein (TIGR03437 family)
VSSDGTSVNRISPAGVVTRVAGNGTRGFSGDGGSALDAQLDGASAIAVDNSGDIFIADVGNSRVRKVSQNGTISTYAGTGALGFSGDGGAAQNAEIRTPYGLAIDASGNLYIADTGNFRLRVVSTGGNISTLMGDGTAGNSGDGGPAARAQTYAQDVAVGPNGDIYVVAGVQIRKISNGTVNTIAGNTGAYGGYPAEGIPAIVASLSAGIEAGGIAVDRVGDVFFVDSLNEVNAVFELRPTNSSSLISAVFDAADERPTSLSPGKIVVIYGDGLGPSQGVTATISNGAFGTQLSGTTVSVNGVAAPVYYTSATQVNAIVPYAISGNVANISVAYQGAISSAFSVPLAASSPSLFSYNATGAGQAASVNVLDGTLNTAVNPVKIGAYISFYATGEGQTTPSGVDGKLGTMPLPSPNLPVTASVGGIPAVVQYKGGVFGTVAGLMQVNVQIPAGVTPGGYVPVVLTVGNASTVNGAVWIAVSN